MPENASYWQAQRTRLLSGARSTITRRYFSCQSMRDLIIPRPMKLRVLHVSFAACLIVSSASAQLTAVDVQTIINRAVTRATQILPNSVIAVTDREGYVLGIWNTAGGEPTPTSGPGGVLRTPSGKCC